MSGPSLGYIAAGIATAVTAIYSPVCAIFVALFSFGVIADKHNSGSGSIEGDEDN